MVHLVEPSFGPRQGVLILTAGEWYIFDGTSQHGPMSHADVVQFLKNFADRNVVSVWRPGLDDWKPASQLFDVLPPTRLVSASEEISKKRRYSFYGLCFGLFVVLADYLFEWRGTKFRSWIGDGIAENIGYIVGTVAVSVLIAFIIGGVVDFWAGRSRRKSVLDPSTFEEPEIIPEVPLDLARYWRGEYSLGVSYWLFGLIGNVTVSILVVGIASLFRTERGYDPRAILGSLICVWFHNRVHGLAGHRCVAISEPPYCPTPSSWKTGRLGNSGQDRHHLGAYKLTQHLPHFGMATTGRDLSDRFFR